MSWFLLETFHLTIRDTYIIWGSVWELGRHLCAMMQWCSCVRKQHSIWMNWNIFLNICLSLFNYCCLGYCCFSTFLDTYPESSPFEIRFSPLAAIAVKYHRPASTPTHHPNLEQKRHSQKWGIIANGFSYPSNAFFSCISPLFTSDWILTDLLVCYYSTVQYSITSEHNKTIKLFLRN